MNCFVYILRDPVGKYYIGQTADLDTRLASHNAIDEIGGRYTRKNGPWTLV